MCWSVESRVPFLTTELAEFSLSVPEDYLVSSRGVTKSLLREAISDFVPAEIVQRGDKIGFETPERDLLLAQPQLFSSVSPYQSKFLYKWQESEAQLGEFSGAAG